MSLKGYQNELIVAAALLLFAGGWLYKYQKQTGEIAHAREIRQELAEVKQLIALKKIWGDPKTAKKVDMLQKSVAPGKVTWQKSAKKLHAVFAGLSAREVNTVVTKILNLPVQIKQLEIDKNGNAYHVECTCKW